MPMYTCIYEKCPHPPRLRSYDYVLYNQWQYLQVPTIHFYIIINFHIQRHFSARLSVRVSNSVQTIKCTIKYFINNTYHRLHHYIPERSTQHHTILHITKILHMKSFFMPACHLRRKISHETKLSHYTLLHPYTLHTKS